MNSPTATVPVIRDEDGNWTVVAKALVGHTAAAHLPALHTDAPDDAVLKAVRSWLIEYTDWLPLPDPQMLPNGFILAVARDQQTLPGAAGGLTAGTVSFTVPHRYTEATHTVYGNVAPGAAPIPLPHMGAGVEQRPVAVTANFHWRTQLGDTRWTTGNIHTHGPFCHANGDEHSPGGAVIHGLDHAPGFAAVFARSTIPHHLILEVPGLAADMDDLPHAVETLDEQSRFVTLNSANVTDLRVSTEVTHTVYGSRITNAGVLLVPGHGGRPDRWMLPEAITVVYLLANRPRDGADAANEWRVLDLSVTGPWVTETGEFDPAAGGTARAPLSPATYPDWVQVYVDTHTPIECRLTLIAA